MYPNKITHSHSNISHTSHTWHIYFRCQRCIRFCCIETKERAHLSAALSSSGPAFLLPPLGQSVFPVFYSTSSHLKMVTSQSFCWLTICPRLMMYVLGNHRIHCQLWSEIFVYPPNSYAAILMPKEMMLVGGTFGRYIDHESEAFMIELVP